MNEHADVKWFLSQQKEGSLPLPDTLKMLFADVLSIAYDFLACNGCFRLFSKIKKGSRASFWYTLSA